MFKTSVKGNYPVDGLDPARQAIARRMAIINLISRAIDGILKSADISFVQSSKLKLEFKVDLEEGKMEMYDGQRVMSGEFSMVDMSFLPDGVDPQVAMLFRRIMQSELSAEHSYNRPNEYFERPY